MEQAAHSSLVGGSTAERRLMCPGSWQMEQKLPASAKDNSSDYADEGTALHACMAYIIEQQLFDAEPELIEEEILGRSFGDEGREYVITRELMDSCVWPCIDFVVALFDELEAEGGELEWFTEVRVQMPGIPDSFGTCDLIVRNAHRTVEVDWKFGVGVLVKAEYEDDEGRRPNSQLMYYGRGAIHTLPKMFETRPDWPVDLYIMQPRARDGDGLPSKCSTIVRELEQFRYRLVAAIAEAKSDDPRIERGDHCRFAPCKAICPKFTGPALDLTKMHSALAERRKGVLGGIDIDWTQTFDDLLQFADIAELWVGEIRTQAHAFLEEGNKIDNWKLVPKRPTEKYTDVQGAVRHVIGLGVDPDQVAEAPEIKSPARLRAALAPLMEGRTKKEKEAAAKAEIGKFTANISSGTTLAPADDKRPALTVTPVLLQQLSEKLASLGK